MSTNHHSMNEAMNKYIDVCTDPVNCDHTEVFVPGGTTQAWTQKCVSRGEFTCVTSVSGVGWLLLTPNLVQNRASITYTIAGYDAANVYQADMFGDRTNAPNAFIDGFQFNIPYTFSTLATTTGLSPGTPRNSYRIVACGVTAKYNTRFDARGGDAFSYADPVNRDISQMTLADCTAQPSTIHYDVATCNEFNVVSHARRINEMELQLCYSNGVNYPFQGQIAGFPFSINNNQPYYDYVANTTSASTSAPAGISFRVNPNSSTVGAILNCRAKMYFEYEGWDINMLMTRCHADSHMQYASSTLQCLDKIHGLNPSRSKRNAKAAALVDTSMAVGKKVINVLAHSGGGKGHKSSLSATLPLIEYAATAAQFML